MDIHPCPSARRVSSAASGVATALTYPSRPITMIVPFAAGGTTDVMPSMWLLNNTVSEIVNNATTLRKFVPFATVPQRSRHSRGTLCARTDFA
jgi:hypothetical protein